MILKKRGGGFGGSFGRNLGRGHGFDWDDRFVQIFSLGTLIMLDTTANIPSCLCFVKGVGLCDSRNDAVLDHSLSTFAE